jgi:hypothetical protein
MYVSSSSLLYRRKAGYNLLVTGDFDAGGAPTIASLSEVASLVLPATTKVLGVHPRREISSLVKYS